MKEPQERLTVRMEQKTYKLLKKQAYKSDKSLSLYVRDLIERQLSIEKVKQDEDIIRTYLRLELEPIIEKYMNRIIKIAVKGSTTSASSMILLAKMLESFVPPHLQEEFNETFNMSRKAGIEYIRLRDSDIEEFLYTLEEKG